MRELRAAVLGVLLVLVPGAASAATLYVNPTQGTHGLSDTFIADVRLDNQNQCVNAIQVVVAYPTDTLKAVDFSKGGSILSLWVEEPKIDARKGIVTFSGGIPGGYCGRIQGDPVLSNILGRIVFTVIGAKKPTATISITDGSAVYLNDGEATQAKLNLQGATFQIMPNAQNVQNPWNAEVSDDKTPPDAFVVAVESTRGVFGGNYYAVFSTQDKQSGIDHYEIFERGAWREATSPHELRDQRLLGGVQVKAIDKAGNERIGTYVEGSAPARVPKETDYGLVILIVASILFLGACMWIWERRRARASGNTPS